MQKYETVSLDHLNLTVRDFNESVAWYGRVFGFRLVEDGITPQGSPWGILRSGDSMLCIYEDRVRRPIEEKNAADQAAHRIYHFGLRIRDRAAWEATVAREKIAVTYGGAYRYPHSTSWYIDDPSGHEIEVALWDGNEVRF